MKRKYGKVIAVVIVVVALIGAVITSVKVWQKEDSSLKPETKSLIGISKPLVTEKTSTHKIDAKDLDIDEENFRKNGKLTKEELEKIKSKLPKGLLKDSSQISITVIKQDGESMNLSPEQRIAMAKAVKEQMSKAFEKMSKEDRAKMRDHLNSPEGEKALRDSMMNYNKQLTGEQRQAADPAFQAILSELNNIKKDKK